MSRRLEEQRNSWAREANDLMRGASGGFLFGIPLLYTMEVWWIGSFTPPERMLVALATTFLVVLLLNRTAGFRSTQDVHLIDAAIDSIEALALGLVCTAFVLILLREITPSTPLDETLGKIIFESVPFAIGVAVASQFLGRGADESDSEQEDETQHHKGRLNATLADIGATALGALFIAFNIAPTDEIPMLAAAVSPPWLVLIIAASLLISYGIVFEANFADQHQRTQQQGIFQRPVSETVASYLVALATAAFMLWFFQQLDLADPWQMWVSHTILLGLPAAVGGAAGRLAV